MYRTQIAPTASKPLIAVTRTPDYPEPISSPTPFIQQARRAPFFLTTASVSSKSKAGKTVTLAAALLGASAFGITSPVLAASVKTTAHSRLAQAQTNRPAADPTDTNPRLTIPTEKKDDEGEAKEGEEGEAKEGEAKEGEETAKPAEAPAEGTAKPAEGTPAPEGAPATGTATEGTPATGTTPAAPATEGTAPAEGAPATGTMPEGTPVTPETPTETPAEGTLPAEGGLADAQAEGREIADVRVVGNRVVPTDSILLQAVTRRGAAFSSRQIQLDQAKIDALGFFATVGHQVTPNLENPEKVDVTFIVQENRVMQQFAFEGNTAIKSEDLAAALESKPGTVLNRNTINRDVAKLQSLYRDKGFAVLVSDVRQSADGTITFVLQEAKICKIEFSGLSKTNPSLVRKQILTKPGDLYDTVKIRNDLNRIFDLGFFEDVNFKADPDPSDPGCLIVTVGLKEKRTGQFSVGIGFDSRSRITGFVTLSENNLRGSGKRAYASIEAGGQRTFDIGFGDPFVGEKNAGYDISVFNRRIYRQPRSIQAIVPGLPANPVTYFYEERRTGARFSYNQPLDFARTKNLLFGYRDEKARLFQTDTTGVGIPINLPLNASGRTSAPSFGFVRDKRDLRLDPSRGGREQIVIEKALTFLGGNTNFTKVDIDVRRYFPLVGPSKVGELPRLVFAIRAVAGKSWGQLPAFEQYFIGGSETVRGYEVDEQFGDNQFYTNIELRFRLQRKLQFVGFFDAGRAAGGRFSSTDTSPVYSVGVGVRLQSPLGPIRLDLGYGLSGNNGGVRTHFAIGPTF